MTFRKKICLRHGNEHLSRHADVLIAGGGASGIFCAMLVSGAGLETVVLEAGAKPCRKLEVSGGGHANFTNLQMTADNFFCQPDSRFCSAALEIFTPAKFMRLLAKWRMPYLEREHGRLFLKNSASELASHMLKSCTSKGCRIVNNERVQSLEVGENCYRMETASGTWEGKLAVLAMGSPARPALAGCTACWNIIKKLGHHVFEPVPALTPFIFKNLSARKKFGEIAGTAVRCRLALENSLPDGRLRTWDDDLLFTHTGLSGPGILRASLFWHPQSSLKIDWLPAIDMAAILEQPDNGRRNPRAIIRRYLPVKVVDALLPSEIASRKIAEISRAGRKEIVSRIHATEFNGLQVAGLDKCEACSGGVDVEEVNGQTFESRLWPGMHILGEMLAVTGELGGYNLHWAFASAYCAAKAITHKV